MNNNLGLILHALIGLAVIGALAALGAVGTITGTQALTGIGTVTGLLLGSSAVMLGSNGTVASTRTPTHAAPQA